MPASGIYQELISEAKLAKQGKAYADSYNIRTLQKEMQLL